jgi:hypothetical protein
VTRRRLHWLLPLACLALTSLTQAGQPGDLERRYLREAARGNLEHVFLFRHLYGYVAMPRTFVMLERSSPDDVVFFVEPHKDATLKDTGTVIPGVFLLGKDGLRKDVDTEHVLPSKPAHSERRGDLKIDYFYAEGDWPSDTVMITNRIYYLLLTGSATALANDMVRTIVALSGPPDILSPGWHRLKKWQDLPPWGAGQLPGTGRLPNAHDDQGNPSSSATATSPALWNIELFE